MNDLPATTVDSLFKHRAAKSATAPFIHFNDTTCTYAECDALIDDAARAIRSMARVEQRFVGLMSTNRPEFVVAYFAILRAGGKVVPINPALGPEEIRYVIEDACIPLLLHPEGIKANLPGARVPLLRRDGVALDATRIDAALQTNPPRFPDDITTVAACIYTSGTTGRPKGALLTHAAIMHNARMCAHGLGSRDGEECLVTVLPLFHAFSASACLMHAVWTGARLILLEQFQPHEILNLMARCKATVFLGVPAMYAVLANAQDTPEIPSWRLCVSGGAPLPMAVSDAFTAKFGMPIHEGDGPTECGPATSINPVDGVAKVGTIGLPLCDVEMKIVDEENNELPDNTVGEIVVRSPSNFIGYLNQPEETAKTLVNAWVHTGDLGTRDDDGYFSIVDRKKDMLIVGGLNVYPREVEEYIHDHPAIAEAAVIGAPDDIRGQIPAAFVALKEGKSLTLADLKSFLRKRIAGYKIPRQLHILDALPRSATGKILKTLLRNRVCD